MEEDQGRRKGEAENKKNKLSTEELSGLGTWLVWEGLERLRAWGACQEQDQNLLYAHMEMPR